MPDQSPSPPMGNTSPSREAVARIILGKRSHWNTHMHGEQLEGWPQYPEVVNALAKADEILALLQQPSEDLARVKRETWSQEARAAVLAVEDQYDISVCSSEHLAEWAIRCERLEADIARVTEERDGWKRSAEHWLAIAVEKDASLSRPQAGQEHERAVEYWSRPENHDEAMRLGLASPRHPQLQADHSGEADKLRQGGEVDLEGLKAAAIEAIALLDVAISGTVFTKPNAGRVVVNVARAQKVLDDLREALARQSQPPADDGDR